MTHEVNKFDPWLKLLIIK